MKTKQEIHEKESIMPKDSRQSRLKKNRNQKKRALSPISLHQGLKTQGF